MERFKESIKLLEQQNDGNFGDGNQASLGTTMMDAESYQTQRTSSNSTSPSGSSVISTISDMSNGNTSTAAVGFSTEGYTGLADSGNDSSTGWREEGESRQPSDSNVRGSPNGEWYEVVQETERYVDRISIDHDLIRHVSYPPRPSPYFPLSVTNSEGSDGLMEPIRCTCFGTASTSHRFASVTENNRTPTKQPETSTESSSLAQVPGTSRDNNNENVSGCAAALSLQRLSMLFSSGSDDECEMFTEPFPTLLDITGDIRTVNLTAYDQQLQRKLR